MSNISHDHAPPRQLRPRCTQVNLVSISRSNCPFHKALWNCCHLSELASFVRFLEFGFVFAPPSRLLSDRQEETGFRAIGQRALQESASDSPAPAKPNQDVAWCETCCLDGERIWGSIKGAASGWQQPTSASAGNLAPLSADDPPTRNDRHFCLESCVIPEENPPVFAAPRPIPYN